MNPTATTRPLDLHQIHGRYADRRQRLRALDRMGTEGRAAAYDRSELDPYSCALWASDWPAELPLAANVALASRAPDKLDRVAAMRRLTPAERLGAYRANQFSLDGCCLWASLYRHEVPILNGEFEFIARSMPEVCER